MTTMLQNISVSADFSTFIKRAFLIASVTLCAAISPSPSRADDYTVVGVPRFNLADGSAHMSGKAFVVQWFRNRSLMVMPMHLLAPSGGYHSYISAADIPNTVRSVDLLDLNRSAVMASADRSLLSDSVPVEKNGGNMSLDLIAFEVRNAGRATKLALAGTPITVGSKAWVLTRTDNSSSSGCDRYAGTVIRSKTDDLSIRLDRPLDAHGSSGSPVVDARGQLIGMMVGMEDQERTIAMCLPAPFIYQKLYKAAGQ